MKTTFINSKKYTVEPVFNMVLNYHFTDKNGVIYLVDGQDVAEWADDEKVAWTNNVDMAVQYAKWVIDMGSDTFWWSIKEPQVAHAYGH